MLGLDHRVRAMAATEAGTRAARALDDLYRRHVGEVYRYAYAVLGNHADAEDVTQTAFVNALRALERGERPRQPTNWLLAITHNIIRQRWRQQYTRPAEVELDADVPDAESDETRPELQDVVRALQRIPPAQREAIVMRELEGRSYREIAEILGLSTSALETLLFRARRSLAEELENVVTCDRAELAISRQLDSHLGRKDRRRLEEHLRECASCASFAAGQRRHRHALRGLAVLPLPVSLALWKGAPAASAAAGLPAIGLGAGAAAGGGAAAAAGAGGAAASAAGGLALGGVAVKVAAVVAAVGVAGGISYEGVKQVQTALDDTPAATKSAQPRAASVARERASSTSRLASPWVIPGKAKGVTKTKKKPAQAAAKPSRGTPRAGRTTATDRRGTRVGQSGTPPAISRRQTKPGRTTRAERPSVNAEQTKQNAAKKPAKEPAKAPSEDTTPEAATAEKSNGKAAKA